MAMNNLQLHRSSSVVACGSQRHISCVPVRAGRIHSRSIPTPAAAAPAAARRSVAARGLVPWTADAATTTEADYAYDVPTYSPSPAAAKSSEPDPEFPMGLSFFPDGASFCVWAPHARGAVLEVAEAIFTGDKPPEAIVGHNKDSSEAEPVAAKGVKQYPLVRMGDNWATVLQPGEIQSGQPYRLVLTVQDETRPIEQPNPGNPYQNRPPPVQTDFVPSAGTQAWDMSVFQTPSYPTNYGSTQYGSTTSSYNTVQYAEKNVKRRDPYALSAHYNSTWCYAFDPTTFKWDDADYKPPTQDELIIYELHIGSFTPEGNLKEATKKLAHVASLGFTAVELMPCAEFSDPAKWGYNPRQLMALHEAYGTPEDMCALVNMAHTYGLAVLMDVVLHHGAPNGNNLWDFDGWTNDGTGGIYHESAVDCQWGRQWAFWKKEVFDMLYGACATWLGTYKMDGLRFDGATDLPVDMAQRLTWQLRENFPGKFLAAELAPEDPNLMKQYGFDAIWVRNYHDVVHQHREFGRSQHVNNDGNGWDMGRLGAGMRLHWGMDSPTQAVKFLLGCHDQVGCQRNGGFYEEIRDIGGQKRYAIDALCGGRGEPRSMAALRLWYAANVGAAGIPLMFMGNEVAQSGWWAVDEWHGYKWDHATDAVGMGLMNCVRMLHMLRRKYGALRLGWSNCIHEDTTNGIMGYERVVEGHDRIVVIVNAGQQSWQRSEYGVWVGGGGSFQEVFCSQNPAFGDSSFISNRTDIKVVNERININIPPQCTLFFRQKSI